MLRRPSSSPLFPYTTLFRSAARHRLDQHRVADRLGGVACHHLMGDRPVGTRHHRQPEAADRKSTRLNCSNLGISYADIDLTAKTAAKGIRQTSAKSIRNTGR